MRNGFGRIARPLKLNCGCPVLRVFRRAGLLICSSKSASMNGQVAGPLRRGFNFPIHSRDAIGCGECDGFHLRFQSAHDEQRRCCRNLQLQSVVMRKRSQNPDPLRTEGVGQLGKLNPLLGVDARACYYPIESVNSRLRKGAPPVFPCGGESNGRFQ